MKYIVSIAYHKFEFTSGTTALNFAQLATENRLDPTDHVEILVVTQEEEDGR